MTVLDEGPAKVKLVYVTPLQVFSSSFRGAVTSGYLILRPQLVTDLYCLIKQMRIQFTEPCDIIAYSSSVTEHAKDKIQDFSNKHNNKRN